MKEQGFTHEAKDGTVRTFQVDAIFAACVEAKLTVTPVAVDEHNVNIVLTERVVEQWRLDCLTTDDLAKPILYLKDVTPGFYLLADGTHRLLRYAMLRMDVIPAFLVPPEIWKPYTIVHKNLSAEQVTQMVTGESNL